MISSQSTQAIQALPLDEHSWRIRDTDLPEDDPASLLAYVQRWNSGVQVVWLTGGHMPPHYATLSDAVAAAREQRAADAAPDDAALAGV